MFKSKLNDMAMRETGATRRLVLKLQLAEEAIAVHQAELDLLRQFAFAVIRKNQETIDELTVRVTNALHGKFAIPHRRFTPEFKVDIARQMVASKSSTASINAILRKYRLSTSLAYRWLRAYEDKGIKGLYTESWRAVPGVSGKAPRLQREIKHLRKKYGLKNKHHAAAHFDKRPSLQAPGSPGHTPTPTLSHDEKSAAPFADKALLNLLSSIDGLK